MKTFSIHSNLSIAISISKVEANEVNVIGKQLSFLGNYKIEQKHPQEIIKHTNRIFVLWRNNFKHLQYITDIFC